MLQKKEWMSFSDAILDDDIGLFRAALFANSRPKAFEGCSNLGRKKQARYTEVLTRNRIEVKGSGSQVWASFKYGDNLHSHLST